MTLTGGASMGLFLLAVAILFNAGGNALFKVASGLEAMTLQKLGLLAGGMALGLVCTLCYIKSLDFVELGVAFPVLSGGSVVVVALVSLVIFGEQLSLRQVTGLVVLGVGLMMVWWK